MTAEFRDFAVDLAVRAGDIMTTNFRLGMTKTWKTDGTPLTVTDLMINDMLLNAVADCFPNHGVIAEESSSPGVDREFVWICDPVDGTVPFSHGIPTFAFSLALVHNGEPVLGVVNDPMSQRLLVAEKGQGALLDEQPIRVSSIDSFETLVIDFEDVFQDALANGSFRTRLRRRGVLVQTLWSAVFGASRVATGELAAMVCNYGWVWDVAAVSVLVTEAGGRVSDLKGNPLKYDEHLHGFVVSNGDIHDALIEELNF